VTSRRSFLWQSVSAAVGGLCGSSLWARGSAAAPAHASLPSGEYFLIGDGTRGNESLLAAPSAPRPARVRIWRPGQHAIREIALPFLPHAFAAHPSAPQRVFAFEKWGTHMAELDLREMAPVRITQAQAGRRFFGHGVCSDAFVYAAQMDDANRRTGEFVCETRLNEPRGIAYSAVAAKVIASSAGAKGFLMLDADLA
jgi:hypothetical protein